jgi:hypothetical protein
VIKLPFAFVALLLLLSAPAAAKPRPVCQPPPNRVKVGEGVIAAAKEPLSDDSAWRAWLASLGAEVDCYVWAAYDSVRKGYVPQAGLRVRDWLRAHDYRDAMLESVPLPRSSWDGMRWGGTPHWGCFAGQRGPRTWQ